MDQLELDFGMVALSDYDEDGFMQIQTDAPGIDGSEGTQPAEALLPTGYYSRPLDPDKGPDGKLGLGSPVIVITYGDKRYAIPLGDPRDVIEGKVPKLKKGGRMLAGGAGEHRSFVMIDGEDPGKTKKSGSIMISAAYSKGGKKKSLGLSFNVRDEGSEDISLLHGDGARVTLDKNGTSIFAANGKSYVEVGADGNVLAGKTKVQGSLAVGQLEAAQALVKGPELVALLTKLIGIITPIVGVSGTGAPAQALTAELAALLTQHIKAT